MNDKINEFINKDNNLKETFDDGSLNYGWDLDHITPISSAKTEEDVIRLNNYTNFQPLCSKVNRDIKKDKLTWQINISYLSLTNRNDKQTLKTLYYGN